MEAIQQSFMGPKLSVGVPLKKMGDGDPMESSVYFNKMPVTQLGTRDNDVFDYWVNLPSHYQCKERGLFHELLPATVI